MSIKIAISGHGRAGKDIAAEWFVHNCGLRYFGSTSKVIWPHAAARLGLSMREAWQRRHEQRQVWFDIGNELRESDPAYLAREVLRQGDLCIGIRSKGEMATVVRERLVDVLLWVDRNVLNDPTLEYNVDDFPFIVVRNHGELADFCASLEWLAGALGILANQRIAKLAADQRQQHQSQLDTYPVPATP